MIPNKLKWFFNTLDFYLLIGGVKSLLSHNEMDVFLIGNEKIKITPYSFPYQYISIFRERIYDVPLNISSPRILDLGAHVGMSCLFFKRRYPKAKVVAFEADPIIYSLLKENIKNNLLTDVELINKAVWIKNGIVEFSRDDLLRGKGRLSSSKTNYRVDSVNLKEWLRDKNFDLIKMNIEGAEHTVIPSAIDELSKVPYIIFEYHSPVNGEQNLGEILCLFSERGFRYYIRTQDIRYTPFRTKPSTEFDNLLMVYLTRKIDFF